MSESLDILQIGQFHKEDADSFITDVTMKEVSNYITVSQAENVSFVDKLIQIQTSTSSFQIGNSYFIKFDLEKTTSEQELLIYFTKFFEHDNKTTRQKIQHITIDATTELNTYYKVNFIATPEYEDFDEILVVLSRVPSDFEPSSSITGYGREINITNVIVNKVINLVETELLSQQKTLLKIGVQGNPGILMAINGEGIRIGKTGFYEPPYSLPISYLGVVLTTEDIADPTKKFILDYQY